MTTPAVNARIAKAEEVAAKVLEAERGALAEIESCKQQAARRVAESRSAAARIHTRNAARVAHFQSRMISAANARRAAIEGEIAMLATDFAPQAIPLEQFDHAIACLVDELAGD